MIPATSINPLKKNISQSQNEITSSQNKINSSRNDIKDLENRISRNREEAKKIRDLYRGHIDVHGRLYGVFIGYAFKGNANEIPIVTYSDLWQWFKEYLTPEWEKKSARTVEVDYLSWDKVKPAHVTDHGTEFYDSAAFNEESLFEEYLARALT